MNHILKIQIGLIAR